MTVDEALEIVRENYRDDTSAGVLAAEVRRLREQVAWQDERMEQYARTSAAHQNSLSESNAKLRAELDRYCGECGGCDAHFKGCTSTEDVTSADGSELEQHR